MCAFQVLEAQADALKFCQTQCAFVYTHFGGKKGMAINKCRLNVVITRALKVCRMFHVLLLEQALFLIFLSKRVFKQKIYKPLLPPHQKLFHVG